MLLSSIILKRDKAPSNSCLMLSNNMKWLYKSWESKICGCAELMIHPYRVHLDKICLRSVKHLISKEIFSHQASQITFSLTSSFIGKIELFDIYIYLNVNCPRRMKRCEEEAPTASCVRHQDTVWCLHKLYLFWQIMFWCSGCVSKRRYLCYIFVGISVAGWVTPALRMRG